MVKTLSERIKSYSNILALAGAFAGAGMASGCLFGGPNPQNRPVQSYSQPEPQRAEEESDISSWDIINMFGNLQAVEGKTPKQRAAGAASADFAGYMGSKEAQLKSARIVAGAIRDSNGGATRNDEDYVFAYTGGTDRNGNGVVDFEELEGVGYSVFTAGRDKGIGFGIYRTSRDGDLRFVLRKGGLDENGEVIKDVVSRNLRRGTYATRGPPYALVDGKYTFEWYISNVLVGRGEVECKH